MICKIVLPACSAAAFTLLVSCGGSSDIPPLAGQAIANSEGGDAIYQEARSAEQNGKRSHAISLYGRVANKYPYAKSAPDARYRQATLLEQSGDVPEAFKAYDQFLDRYPGSGLYSQALNRQASLAQRVADGDIKAGFMGMKTRYSVDKTVEMLEKVRDNAPRSRTAAKAQFTIGQLYRSQKRKAKESIEAFRKVVADHPSSPEAPEALFNVGMVLMEDADRKNQDRANLDAAREAFNDYLNQYPGHKRAPEARNMLAKIGGQDVRNAFDIAEFYYKTGKTESAKIYYRDVVKRSSSGKLRDKAQARLKSLGE